MSLVSNVHFLLYTYKTSYHSKYKEDRRDVFPRNKYQGFNPLQ
jgi:hypothetical protein